MFNLWIERRDGDKVRKWVFLVLVVVQCHALVMSSDLQCIIHCSNETVQGNTKVTHPGSEWTQNLIKSLVLYIAECADSKITHKQWESHVSSHGGLGLGSQPQAAVAANSSWVSPQQNQDVCPSVHHHLWSVHNSSDTQASVFDWPGGTLRPVRLRTSFD